MTGRIVDQPLTVGPAGYLIVDSGLSPERLEEIRSAIAPTLREHTEKGGVRNVLDRVPSLGPLVTGHLRDFAVPTLGPAPFAVRVLLFDKTPTANWKVTWHQDVTVAVTEYRDAAGWGPWSRKDGVWHVRPPAAVLAGMLTVRLHLDHCGPDNGPVRVIPGTHERGRMSDSEVEAAARARAPVDCLVPEGGVLIMRPLLLHCSAPAAAPSHRRVVHVEYAATDLPDGFRWAERDGIRG